MHIGEEIRRRREEQELTGFQLAVKAGMAPSAVSQIETGKRVPSSASVVKLAEALGVDVGELYPKAQIPLPFEDARLMDRPEVGEWLRGHGHITDAEFLSWAETLKFEIDEEGIPRGIEEAIEELHEKRDELLTALRTSEARKTMFSVPPGISKEETKSWLLKPPGRWELANEIRHEYLARELALVNYSQRLYAEDKTSDYLVYGPPGEHDDERHQLFEKRRRVLRESYAKARAA
jgi:transcriptional regulator with XRE-family HTH domain